MVPVPVFVSVLDGRCVTSDTGFMIAASAEMGRFLTELPCDMSTMTTWVEPPVLSHTVMNFSDSIEHELNLTHSEPMPAVVRLSTWGSVE